MFLIHSYEAHYCDSGGFRRDGMATEIIFVFCVKCARGLYTEFGQLRCSNFLASVRRRILQFMCEAIFPSAGLLLCDRAVVMLLFKRVHKHL